MALYTTGCTHGWDMNKSDSSNITDGFGSITLTNSGAASTVAPNASFYFYDCVASQSDYLTGGTTAQFNSSTFTFEIGVKINTGATNTFAAKNIRTSGKTYGWHLFYDSSSGKVTLNSYNNSLLFSISTVKTDWVDGQSYHIGIRSNGTTKYIYIDGTLDAQVTDSGVLYNQTTATMYVARSVYPGQYGNVGVYFIREWISTDIGEANLQGNAAYEATRWTSPDKTWTQTVVPNVTTEPYAITTEILQDRSITMPVPDVSAEPYAPTIEVIQDRTIEVSAPDVTSEPHPLTVDITSGTNATWTQTTIPDATSEALAVTTSIRQDRTVSMSAPNCAANPSSPSTAVIQDRTVALTAPDALAEDHAVSTSIIQDITIEMSAPNVTAEPQAVTPLIGGGGPDVTLDVPAPSVPCAIETGYYHLFFTYDESEVEGSRLKGYIDKVNDDALTGDDTTVYNPDEPIYIGSYQSGFPTQNRLHSTLLLTRIYDEKLGQTLIDQNTNAEMWRVTGNVNVAMSHPDSTAETYPVTTSIRQDRTISMSSPDVTTEVPVVTVDIEAQAVNVPMTSPTALADAEGVTTEITQDRTVEVSSPTATAQPQAVTLSKSQTISVSSPSAVAESEGVSVALTSSPTVAMSHPNAVTDVRPVSVNIGGQEITVNMYAPDAIATAHSIAIEIGLDVSSPDSLAETQPVTVGIVQNRTVSMSAPDCIAETWPVEAFTRKSIIVDVPSPDVIAEAQEVIPSTADYTQEIIAFTVTEPRVGSISVEQPTSEALIVTKPREDVIVVIEPSQTPTAYAVAEQVTTLIEVRK